MVETIESLQAENARLQQQVELYQQALDALSTGIFLYKLEDQDDDRTLQTVAVNPAVGELTGVVPEQIIGKTLDENFPGLREQGVPQSYANVVRTGEPLAFETVYGDERIIESAFDVRAVALPDNHVLVMFDNITQRKQAEAEVRQLNEELEQRIEQRTEELRQSQILLQGILDHSPAIIYVKDTAGKYLLTNRRFQTLFHLDDEYIISKTDYDFFPPDIAEQFRHNDQVVVSAGSAQESEEVIFIDGEEHTYLSAKFPIFDAEGQIYATGGISTDVTERKESEEKLRMAQFSLDTISDGVQWLDWNGQHIYVNDAFCRSLGYTREEVLAMRLDEIDPNITLESWQEQVWTHVQREGELALETMHRRKDGSLLHVEVRGTAMVFDGQQYLCAVARDISERKEAEEKLRIFRALNDNAPDGVVVSDLDSIVTYFNDAFHRLTGYDEQDIGRHVYDFYAEDKDTLNTVTQHVHEHGCWQGNLGYRRRDGSSFMAQLSLFAVLNPQGEPVALARIIRDLTSQQQAELEHARLQQQLIDAQQAALRELSTPLIPISDHVVIMPLIGSIDSLRAQQVMEALLEGVAAHHADTVILDITGVQVVDTQVANTFVQAARAVQLLGARVMLTGIQPGIAQTLVQLGVDLSGIDTRSSLQAGIAATVAQH